MPIKPTKKASKNTLASRVHKHVKLAVVPHKANEHRPHLVRRYGIALVLVAVVLSQGVYNAIASGNILGTQDELTQSSLLEATNLARAEHGITPLAENSKLQAAAQLKVDNMFEEQYWAHTAPSGATPWYWVKLAQYSYAEAGENLAKNFNNSDAVVSAWMLSPTHRDNVLKAKYQEVGFAIKTGELHDEPTTIIVALYASPSQYGVTGGIAEGDIAAVGGALSPMLQFGLLLQSLGPVTIASIVLLLFVANIALLAHLSRRKLPPKLRKSWYRHHGVYKAVFLVLVATLLVAAYSGTGQI